MAKKEITIIEFDDVTSNALVLFEDKDINFAFRTGIWVPNDIVDEDDMLNFFATYWPETEYALAQEPEQDRQAVVKAAIQKRKNIKNKAEDPKNNPRHPSYDPGSP